MNEVNNVTQENVNNTVEVENNQVQVEQTINNQEVQAVSPSVEVEAEQPSETKEEPPKKKGNKKVKIFIIIVILVLLVIGGGIAFIIFGEKDNSKDNKNNNTANTSVKCNVDFNDEKVFTKITDDVYRIDFNFNNLDEPINICSYYIMKRPVNKYGDIYEYDIVLLNEEKYLYYKDNPKNIYNTNEDFKLTGDQQIYFIKSKNAFLSLNYFEVRYINEDALKSNSYQKIELKSHTDKTYIKDDKLYIVRDKTEDLTEKTFNNYCTTVSPNELSDNEVVMYTEVYDIKDFDPKRFIVKEPVKENTKTYKQYYKEQEDKLCHGKDLQLEKFELEDNQEIQKGPFNIKYIRELIPDDNDDDNDNPYDKNYNRYVEINGEKVEIDPYTDFAKDFTYVKDSEKLVFTIFDSDKGISDVYVYEGSSLKTIAKRIEYNNTMILGNSLVSSSELDGDVNYDIMCPYGSDGYEIVIDLTKPNLSENDIQKIQHECIR